MALVGVSCWIGMWLFGAVRLWSVGPLLFMVFLAAALVLLRPAVMRGGFAWIVPPGAWMLLAWLAYAACSIPRAASPYDAQVEVLKVAGGLCAYALWTQLAQDGGRWRWLLALFFFAVTAMSLYAVVQHAQGSRMVLNLVRPESYGMRASGAYFCPNHFANLLALTAPMALVIVLTPASGWSLRLLAGYTFVALWPPLYLTQSRSGWLGALVGITLAVCLMGLRRSVKRFMALLAVVPLVAGGLAVAAWRLSPVIQHRVADALRGNVRLQLWQDTLGMVAAQPWWGFGPMSYRWVYPHYWRHMDMYLDPQFAHNDYLQFLAEYGAVGALLLGAAVVVAVAQFGIRLRSPSSERGSMLAAGFLGSLAAAAAHACFDYSFHIYANVQALLLLAGVAAAVSAPSSRAPRSDPTARAWGVLAVLPLLLMALTARATASYGYVLKGDFQRDALEWDASARSYRRAVAVDGRNWQAHLGLGHVMGMQAFWNRDPALRKEQADQAMAAYQVALDLNPWSTDAQFGISRIYKTRGDAEAALATLRSLVEKVPFHRDFLVELGLQLREMGRFQEALEAFERARAVKGGEMIELNIQLLRQKIAAAN